jgi:hypothetical protein
LYINRERNNGRKKKKAQVFFIWKKRNPLKNWEKRGETKKPGISSYVVRKFIRSLALSTQKIKWKISIIFFGC